MIEDFAQDAALRAITGGALGMIAGSFLATLVVRWPEGRSVAFGRSACDGCWLPLRVWELVPLVSFIVQRGRCRRCGATIDPRHPIVELLSAVTGALFFGVAPGWNGVAGAIFGWVLIALAALDLRHLWLPDRLTLPLLGLGLGLGAAAIVDDPGVVDRVAGAAVGYAVLALVARGYRRVRGQIGLGAGDAKLFAAIGAWLGWRDLPLVLLIASIGGLAVCGGAIALGRRLDRSTALPFGTFLAVAGWAMWLWRAAT